MSSGGIAEPAEVPVAVDAFGLYPHARSIIGGLGGADDPPYPAYGLHTPYVAVTASDAAFTVRFAGLAATRGTLGLFVHALPPGSKVLARIVAERRVPLADLAADGGILTLGFATFPPTTYALHALVEDDTDARASGVAIDMAGSVRPPDYEAVLAAAKAGPFDPDDESPLLAAGPATLREPVSQACTAGQFEEPDYRRWTDAMGVGVHLHRKQWEFVYILRVLERYGMLVPGMRGLGFGVGLEPLPASMAARGVAVVATDLPPEHSQAAGWSATGQHVASLDGMRNPHICDDETFSRLVSFRAVDMTAIPDDLHDFDFTWSACAYEHLGSIAAGLRFFEESVRCLRPGGIAVHTTELNIVSNDDTLDNDSTVLFRRRDMEELALRLIAAGHRVAPIRLDLGDRPLDRHVDVPPYSVEPHLKLAVERWATTSFGLIAQRGPA